MRKIRLRLIQMDVDFRKSEETNFLDLKKQGKIPKCLKKGDGILLVSKSGKQFVFVEPYVEYDSTVTGGEVSILPSQRGRIRGGSWSPIMLSEYAREVGLTIEGIKRFEWYFREREQRREAA